jgi:hypothetical protein
VVGALDKKRYKPRIYVHATSDALSGGKALEAERQFQTVRLLAANHSKDFSPGP